MNSLTIKALSGFAKLLVTMGVLLFLPARSFDYWEAWVYLSFFFIPVLAISIYFVKRDPNLIERRLKAGPTAERRTTQKVIQLLASLFFLLLIIVPAVDHWLHWSHVPAVLVIASDLGVFTGLLIVFFVFRENSYTSAAIEVAPGQSVISTGPYSSVRHPMYSGALLLIFLTPIALGSWWGTLAAIPMLVVIVMRLLDEERFLAQNLPGYKEYCREIRYRLIPGIW